MLLWKVLESAQIQMIKATPSLSDLYRLFDSVSQTSWIALQTLAIMTPRALRSQMATNAFANQDSLGLTAR